MDKVLFFKALSTYHQEKSTPICRPDGLFLSNTGSEVFQFEYQNTVLPPFRTTLLESSEPPAVLFKLQQSPADEQQEILAAISGQSKQDLVVGLRISNTGLLDFYCARLGESANLQREDTSTKPKLYICRVPLSDTVQHLRLKIEYGLSTAYLLEQFRSTMANFSRATICQTLVTEVIDGHKTRRFSHTHVSNQPVDQTWFITNYTINPT